MSGLEAFKAFVEEVRSRCDLVDVIGGDIDLRRVGSVYKGLSPFHAERHASLVVWPNTQTWHDFSAGGGAGGDVFSYVQEREKVGFKEAVRLLAERAGVQPPNQDDASWQQVLTEASERRAVERLLGQAAAYYHQQLPAEIRAQYYHQHYGFTDETVDELKLGWADGGLFKHWTQAGVSRQAALATGLFVALHTGVVDYFQNRLVFPYWRGGRVVYFTGRATALTRKAKWEEAKYKKLRLRSDKAPYISATVGNDTFFNEDAARGADELVLTEGTPDCISARQCGVACISPGTTSFRAQDLPRLLDLARDAKRIVICNDAEASGAGESAARALAAQIWAHGREVCIATIPRAPEVAKVDLNELVVAGGADALRAVLAAALPYPEYLLAQIPEDTPRSALDRELEPVFGAIGTCSPIRADAVLDAIAKRFSIGRRDLKKQLTLQQKQVASANTKGASDRSARRTTAIPEGARPVPEGKQDGSPPPSSSAPRPRIIIRTEEHAVVDEAIAALARLDGIYARGNLLVHVVQDDSPLAGIVFPAAENRIFPLGAAGVREQLTRAASWMITRTTEHGVEEILAHPPSWVTPQIEARKRWSKVPHLTGVIDSPVLRHDGTVIEEPGYDQRTGLLYLPNQAYPAVPASPTQSDATAAMAELLEIVVDFPFQSEAHRAAWIAGLLTPSARYAFSGPSPLFLMDANVRSSGKSLLADLIGEVVSGRAMPRTPQAVDENEEIKRITATAIEGTRFVLIDNIDRPLGSGALDTVLTGTVWSDRILGKSERVHLPLLTVWYATGNNVTLKGDLTRRCLHVRLDSALEKPEYRDGFLHPDVLGWAHAHRPRLVVAGLTILRAYCLADKPSMGLKKWGSFEGWSALVRDAVVWAGLQDPGETRADLDAIDVDGDALRNLIAGWTELPNQMGTDGCTAARVLEILNQDVVCRHYPRLRSALAELCPHPPGHLPDARKVGYALRRFRGRVVDGARLQTRMFAGNNLWFVEQLRRPDADEVQGTLELGELPHDLSHGSLH